MKFYQRAIRCLLRKKGKNSILLLVLLVINSMILCTITILHATEETKLELQEKTKSKLICDIRDENNPLIEEDVNTIEQLGNIKFINKMSSAVVTPVNFLVVTGGDSSSIENTKANLWGYNNLEMDGPFAEKQLRLVEGKFPTQTKEILIDKLLAEYNQLSIGESITIENDRGKEITGQISGIFSSGSEEKQGKNVAAIYRIENQIYVEMELFQELFEEKSYNSVAFYVSDPAKLQDLEIRIMDTLGEKCEITKADMLYQQMKAPLEQISRVVKLMFGLTVGTSVVIVTLLLSMWMRARKREIAVYISLGESKRTIYLQCITESIIVFSGAILGALALGNIAANSLKQILLKGQENAIDFQLSLQSHDVGMMILIGGIILIMAIGISLLPVLRAKPKEILAEMEG